MDIASTEWLPSLGRDRGSGKIALGSSCWRPRFNRRDSRSRKAADGSADCSFYRSIRGLANILHRFRKSKEPRTKGTSAVSGARLPQNRLLQEFSGAEGLATAMQNILPAAATKAFEARQKKRCPPSALDSSNHEMHQMNPEDWHSMV
jgi:hypothetical protein